MRKNPFLHGGHSKYREILRLAKSPAPSVRSEGEEGEEQSSELFSSPLDLLQFH